MSTYTPDRWSILKIERNGEAIHKVFANWYGGYAAGDSWSLNSGIVSIKDAGDLWEITGYSGSVYLCHKEYQGMSGYGATVYNQLLSNFSGTIEIVELNSLSDIQL
jgi:hypothetical protein